MYLVREHLQLRMLQVTCEADGYVFNLQTNKDSPMRIIASVVFCEWEWSLKKSKLANGPNLTISYDNH